MGYRLWVPKAADKAPKHPLDSRDSPVQVGSHWVLEKALICSYDEMTLELRG